MGNPKVGTQAARPHPIAAEKTILPPKIKNIAKALLNSGPFNCNRTLINRTDVDRINDRVMSENSDQEIDAAGPNPRAKNLTLVFKVAVILGLGGFQYGR